MAKKEVHLRGTVTLSIDPEMLTAMVTFTKSGEGQDWTSESLIHYLTTNKIAYGYSPTEIQRQFKIAAEKTDPVVTFTAAKGEPVEPNKPESVDWKFHEFPEPIQPLVEKKLEGSPAPILFSEIQIKVKRQKEVEKKSPIPFVAPKKEMIEVIETETKKERVYVDPTVEKTGWVEEGEPVGIFYIQQKGKPGTNLHGDPIPPAELPDPRYYLGDNLEKKGHDIIAKATGILRTGKNWADVLPLLPHTWELILSPDKATCLLTLVPGDPTLPPPSYEEIIQKATVLEFPIEKLISKSEMEHLVREHILSSTPVEHLALTGHDDAFFDVVVSEDSMQALLNIKKGQGQGKPLVLKEVGKAIRDSKVRIPDQDILRQDILNFYSAPETELIGYILAEGKKPKKGADQMVDWSARFFDEKDFLLTKQQILDSRESFAHLESAGEFPLDDLSDLAFVDKDSRILTLGPPSKGEPGIDVFGNPVEGLAGRPVELKIYEGLVQRDNVLIAGEAGIFERVYKEGVYYLRIRPHKDSDISIEVSGDNLTAYISFSQSQGSGKKITMDRIHRALEDYGVVEGVHHDSLEKIREILDAEQDCPRLLIATGTPAEEGGAYKLQMLVNMATGQKVTIRSDGTADYKNRDQITRVAKDTPLARVLPPLNEPKAGKNVYGKEIPPSTSRNEDLLIGANIRVENEEEGVRLLYADSDGELVVGKNSIEVKGVYTIQGNVNIKTGNIKFPGTVQVSGDVESGFAVLSDGDVKIGGSVDASLVSAGGDILLKGGVKGNQKGVLRAKGNILAAFIEQATILAVGNMKVLKNCLRSSIKCNGKLSIPEKGAIIGGITKVRKGLEVGNLGSPRTVPTRIHFGQDYLVEDQIMVEEKEIKKTQEQIAQIDLAMKKPDIISNKVELQQMFNQKTKLLKLLEKRNLRLFVLKERFEQHFESELRVRGSIFPGVLLESHGRTLEVTLEKKNVVYTFDFSTARILEKAIEKKE